MAILSTDPHRRAFIGCVAGFSLTPAIGFVAAPVTDPIPGLCQRYLSFDPVLDDMWSRRDAEYDRVVSQIGECPAGAGNAVWWAEYRQSAAYQIEGEHEHVADQQCRLMEQICRTQATTRAGVAAKLHLWQVTHANDSEDGAYLIASAIDDLQVLS